MRDDVVGLELDGFQKIRLGRFPVPILQELDIGQRHIGFGKIRVESQSFPCCGSRFGHGNSWRVVRIHAVPLGADHNVGIPESNVSESEVGIAGLGFLEENYGVLDVDLPSAVQKKAPLQIGLVGRAILGRLSQLNLLLSRELQSQCSRDISCDVVLDQE